MKRNWLLGSVVALGLVLVCGLAWSAPEDDDPFAPLNAKKPAPKEEPKDPFKELTKPPKATGKRDFASAMPKQTMVLEPATARRGETVTWKFTVELAPGWRTYPTTQTEADAEVYVTEFTFKKGDLIPVGKVIDAPAKSKVVPELELKDYRYYNDTATWTRPLVVSPDATPGDKIVSVEARFIVCDEKGCLQPTTVTLTAPIKISDAPAVQVDPKYAGEIKNGGSVSPPPQVGKPKEDEKAATLLIKDKNAADYKARMETLRGEIQTTDAGGEGAGLMAFILAGVFWGAVSLITPCVFPMIPITVSYFLKASEKEHHKPLTMAIVYCATIVIVLTIAAVTLLSFFRLLSVNPVMNYGLGALFIFFALSLFGMYEIELPQGLARFTSAHEGQGGLAGTMFMALTFTIISFACVAPFLGGFGGTAASSSMTWSHRIFGGLAFSITFASPFFILALFPALLKKMPKSGNWLNNVKVVMGFLELAAALKFLRAAELVLVPQPVLFTYDFVLGLWIALALLCGLYLLGVYRLPLDTPVEHLSVPRLMFSFAFLGLAFYLVPAMFKFTTHGESQRPNGVIYAWVDSFLLPEPQEGGTELAWSGDLPRAVEEARNIRRQTGERKLVFVDFTGETCTNCKINERSVFSKSEFQKLFKPYQLVQLYTDKVPDRFYDASVRSKFDGTQRQRADAIDANLEFQKATFNDEKLPLYAILEPTLDGKVKVVGVYTEGKINNEGEFAEFLRKPQEEAAQASR